MNIIFQVSVALFALSAVPLVANAADITPREDKTPAPPSVTADWSAEITLYGWALGINGTVQTFSRVPPVHANVGFDQLLKNLDGGIMLSGSALIDRYVFFGDLVYAKVSPNKHFQIDPRYNINGTLTLDATSFMGLAAAGYRVYVDPTASLDLMIGARVFAVDTSINLSVSSGTYELGNRLLASRNETWVDGVVGIRGIYNITDNVRLTGIAFVGGISSKYEWDVFASIGYDFTKNWSAFIGYRALGVNYRSSGFVYDVVQHGPAIGISVRF